jgi:hypothetical protein
MSRRWWQVLQRDPLDGRARVPPGWELCNAGVLLGGTQWVWVQSGIGVRTRGCTGYEGFSPIRCCSIHIPRPRGGFQPVHGRTECELLIRYRNVECRMSNAECRREGHSLAHVARRTGDSRTCATGASAPLPQLGEANVPVAHDMACTAEGEGTTCRVQRLAGTTTTGSPLHHATDYRRPAKGGTLARPTR